MRKSLFVILFALINSTIAAQKSTYTKITDVQRMESLINKNAAALHSIQCDFIQEKNISYLNEVVISKGKFWYKKENNLRWEYNTPFKYTILIKGDKFSIIDGKNISNYNINSNPAFKEINDIIISMAKGNMIKDNKFNIEAYEDASSYLFVLVPKDSDLKKFLIQSDVYIEKANLFVTKVVMKESDKDYTTITFLNRKNNEDINDSIFLAK